MYVPVPIEREDYFVLDVAVAKSIFFSFFAQVYNTYGAAPPEFALIQDRSLYLLLKTQPCLLITGFLAAKLLVCIILQTGFPGNM